jgi:hypothetical protein
MAAPTEIILDHLTEVRVALEIECRSMRRRLLYRRGDRVRLTVPTLDGWLGTATVTKDQEPNDLTVSFAKDDVPEGEDREGCAHWVEVELTAP